MVTFARIAANGRRGVGASGRRGETATGRRGVSACEAAEAWSGDPGISLTGETAGALAFGVMEGATVGFLSSFTGTLIASGGDFGAALKSGLIGFTIGIVTAGLLKLPLVSNTINMKNVSGDRSTV